MTGKELKEALGPMVLAIRSVSHGDVNGATGLEALGMALCETIADAADKQGEGLRQVAEAPSEVAAAISSLSPKNSKE